VNQAAFKKVSRRLVIELGVAVVLAGYFIKLPIHKPDSQEWQFVFMHPTILLHIMVAAIIMVEAGILLIRSLRARNAPWIILSLVGLALVLLAFATGERFVVTQKDSALTYMGNAGAGAMAAYGFGWYWGHKKPKVQKAAAAADISTTPE
jgi:hypothetical protein